jgi:predicted nucleotide-binding protein
VATKEEQLLQQIEAAKDGNPDDFDTWKAEAGVVLRHAVGTDDPLVAQFEDVNYGLLIVTEATPQSAWDRARAGGVSRAVSILRAAVTQVRLTEESGKSSDERDLSARTRIFIVHGHDDGLKETVARFLLRLTDSEPVILHEQTSGSATIIEKLERFTATARYAVVIATGDDVGRSAAAEPGDELPRARQNVVFELGYFFAALGRSNVALLYQPGVERPSDTDGIVHITLDDGGAWKVALTRELEGAGIETDRAAL